MLLSCKGGWAFIRACACIRMNTVCIILLDLGRDTTCILFLEDCIWNLPCILLDIWNWACKLADLLQDCISTDNLNVCYIKVLPLSHFTIHSYLLFQLQRSWAGFRNRGQRSEKIYKHRSGQLAEPMIVKKKWQLESFTFLKDHILPRSYTKETSQVIIVTDFAYKFGVFAAMFLGTLLVF